MRHGRTNVNRGNTNVNVYRGGAARPVPVYRSAYPAAGGAALGFMGGLATASLINSSKSQPQPQTVIINNTIQTSEMAIPVDFANGTKGYEYKGYYYDINGKPIGPKVVQK